MRFARLLIVLILVAAPGSAWAQVDGGDFDGYPIGPLPQPLTSPRILGGDPGAVSIIPAGSEAGAPTVSTGSGNVLCIDNRTGTADLIIEFDYFCPFSPVTACALKYDFSAGAHFPGAGYDVHIDANGDYSNPNDLYLPPVGAGPSTTFGGKTFYTGACDESQHTVTFRVFPGGVLYLDNMEVECVDPGTPVEPSTWGLIKSLYGGDR